MKINFSSAFALDLHKLYWFFFTSVSFTDLQPGNLERTLDGLWYSKDCMLLIVGLSSEMSLIMPKPESMCMFLMQKVLVSRYRLKILVKVSKSIMALPFIQKKIVLYRQYWKYNTNLHWAYQRKFENKPGMAARTATLATFADSKEHIRFRVIETAVSRQTRKNFRFTTVTNQYWNSPPFLRYQKYLPAS